MMIFIKNFILFVSFVIFVCVLICFMETMLLGSIQSGFSKIENSKMQTVDDMVTNANRNDLSMIENPKRQTVDDIVTNANRSDVYMVNGTPVLVAVIYDMPAKESSNLLRSLKLYLKTLAIFNKQLVNVILVMNKNEYLVTEAIKDWPQSYRTRLNITVVQPWYPSEILNTGFNKKGGVERLLLAQMFPRLSYALYTDIDIAFLRPVSDLFRELDTFNATQFIGGAGISTYCPLPLPMCYNSGFMLMNLTRMRNYPVYFPNLIAGFMNVDRNTDDQMLYNTIVIKTKPEIFKALPAGWNVILQMCKFGNRFPEAVQFDGWSVIHGTERSYFHIPDFKVIVEVLEDWKMGSDEETLVTDLEKATKALVDDNSTPLLCDRARFVDWVTYYPKKSLLQ